MVMMAVMAEAMAEAMMVEVDGVATEAATTVEMEVGMEVEMEVEMEVTGEDGTPILYNVSSYSSFFVQFIICLYILFESAPPAKRRHADHLEECYTTVD